MSSSHLMNTYNRQPVAFERGEGVWLWDAAGNRYLDGLGGIAVNTLGHAHPRLTKALQEQVGKLMHTSNLYGITWQEKLAGRLCAISGMDNVFFCNSGCEANEAALKLARLYGHRKGIEFPHVIVMENAFHGRTIATLSATGNRKVQIGFEPLVEGFVRVPYNDIAAIERVAVDNKNVVAIFLETIQGEGGIKVADITYMQALRRICDERGWLLMMDEVQCGTGRTGKWFAYQHADILPDVVPLAKGLASGVPIGACMAHGVAAQTFQPGNHGTTFGGNPLACRSGWETLAIIEEDRLMENAERIGALIRTEMKVALAGVRGVVEIRGRGLMIGIQLDRPCADLVKRALAQKLLINVTQESVIRLLPALIMNETEARQLVAILAPLVRGFLAESAQVVSAA